MSIVITDNELNQLLQVEKFLPQKFHLPTENETLSCILDTSTKEIFQLNISRKNTLELVRKSKVQGSYYKEPLVRVEVDAPPHTNPDLEIVGRNHIHIYREGYGMRWAYPLESFHHVYFKQPFEFVVLFDDFCQYFHITSDSHLQGVISCTQI